MIDFSPEKRRHRVRMRRLDRAKGKLTKPRIRVAVVIAFVATVLYYGMIVMSWWQAPIYMLIGYGIDWLMREGDKHES